MRVLDELSVVVKTERRVLGKLVLVAPLREVDCLAQAIDGLKSHASQRGRRHTRQCVVDDPKNGGDSLVRKSPSGVDGPHLVGFRGSDGVVVRVGATHSGRLVQGKDAVVAYEPGHAEHRCGHRARG